MVFPVVMYGRESWTVKKAERRRIDASELWCWRRLLRVPWTARRSNQSILKEISPGCSLEGLMLKLKLQYFGHLMWRVDSLRRLWCWEGLGAGGEGDDRGWDSWMASPTWWTWVWVNSGSWWWTGRPGVLWFMGSQSRTQLINWTELNWTDARSKLYYEMSSFWLLHRLHRAFVLILFHWELYFKIFIYYYFYCYIFNPEMLTIEWEKNLIRFSMFKNMRINYFINILKIIEIHKWLWTLETKGKKWTMEDEMVVASPTQCTWVWASFQRWWWTGKPGMLQSMRSQWVGHDWLTEQQQKWTWRFSFIVIL